MKKVKIGQMITHHYYISFPNAKKRLDAICQNEHPLCGHPIQARMGDQRVGQKCRHLGLGAPLSLEEIAYNTTCSCLFYIEP
jgi:hypothetical protein